MKTNNIIQQCQQIVSKFRKDKKDFGGHEINEFRAFPYFTDKSKKEVEIKYRINDKMQIIYRSSEPNSLLFPFEGDKYPAMSEQKDKPEIVLEEFIQQNINTDTLDLRLLAKKYFDWGFNVCAVKEYRVNQTTGEMTFAGKSPYHRWVHLKNQALTEKELNKYDYQNCSGLGAVSGINDIRCIDFDKCEDLAFIQDFLQKLGLPKDYQWLVKSGSGKGFHIWLKCLDYPSQEQQSAYTYQAKSGHFDHLELRWNSFTVLPPSLHQAGNRYQFAFAHFPSKPPSNIAIETIIEAVQQIAWRANEEKIEVQPTDYQQAKNPTGNRFDSVFEFGEWVMKNKSQYAFVDGQKSNFRYNFANLLNKYGVLELDALNYLLNKYPSQAPQPRRAELDVKSAYRQHEKHNTLKFTPYAEWKEQQILKEKSALGEANNKLKFPIRALPEIYQAIIAHLYETNNFPQELCGMSLLCVASGMIGNAVKIQVREGWIEPAMIWGILVADSGFKKTPITEKWFMRPLYEKTKQFEEIYAKEKAEFLLLELEARCNKVAFTETLKPKRHIYANSFTMEGFYRAHLHNPKGLLLYRDEVIGWVNSMNQYRSGADLQNWLSIHSNGAIKQDLANVDKSFFLSNCFGAVLGGTQFNRLPEFAKGGKDKDGYLFRLLFTFLEDNQLKKVNRVQMEDPAFYSRYEAMMNHLIDLPYQESIIITWDNSLTQHLFYDWQDHNIDLMNQTNNSNEKSIYSKLEAHVARFALILEMLEWTSQASDVSDLPISISQKNLDGAIQLVEYFRQTALQVQTIVNAKSNDSLGMEGTHLALYEALPEEFDTKTLQVACQVLDIRGGSIYDYLNFYKKKELVLKIGQSRYKKTL